MTVKANSFKVTVTFILLLFLLCLPFLEAISNKPAHAQGNAFSDLERHWAKPFIVRLIDLKIISGFPDGTFRPEDVVTREQFVKVLVQTKGYPLVKARTSFTDVNPKRWSNPYIEAAVDAGIIVKHEYGKAFEPTKPMTRQEMAAMAARALKLQPVMSTLNFHDSDQIGPHRGLIGAAVAMKFITGYPDQTFKPAKTLTRAESAVIITRLLDREITEYTLVAEKGTLQVTETNVKEVWTYGGTVPGKEIRVKEGNILRVKLVNQLPVPVTIHWHGIPLHNEMDGVPGVTQSPLKPGETFTYEFLADVPGTYMYHSHFQTFEQVNKGLFGPLVVEEKKPAVRYNRDYVLMYDPFGVNGKLGASIPKLKVKDGERVKLRLINLGLSSYSIYLNGVEFKVTHTDGQPINEPANIKNTLLYFSIGERLDLDFIADSSKNLFISKVVNGKILENTKVEFEFEGLQADYVHHDNVTEVQSAKLLDLTKYGKRKEAIFDHVTAYNIEYSMELGSRDHGAVYTINEKAFHEDHDPIQVREGDKVKVKMKNTSNEDHPMHLHGHFFQVLSKNGTPVSGSPLMKDTLNVRPGEEYEVAFIADNPGNWMFHCHNLIHSSKGMMTMVHYKDYEADYKMNHDEFAE